MTDFQSLPHSPHQSSSTPSATSASAENHNRALFSRTLPSSSSPASASSAVATAAPLHQQPTTIDQMMPMAPENSNRADGNGVSGAPYHGTDFNRNGPMIENIFEIEVSFFLLLFPIFSLSSILTPLCLYSSPSHLVLYRMVAVGEQ
jgi:hypothetical protein